MTSGKKTRVLVIDDSALVRRILTDAISAEPDLEVVGTAPDPIVAEEKIRLLNPDVLTVDIEMPRMDGITFLRRQMASRPIPAVVISSLAQAGCKAALDALEAGAVEVLAKPSGPFSVPELKSNLVQKVRAAAQAKIGSKLRPQPRTMPVSSSPLRPPAVIPTKGGVAAPSRNLIAIGASTGGTEAVRTVLEDLPADAPPVLVVQHIPPVFSRAFAERLDGICAIRVKEAEDGDPVRRGVALIAPGDYHMTVAPSGAGYVVRLNRNEKVCYQRPAVDVLFESLAQQCGRKCIAALLTGMGNDGAAGLLKLRNAGARTIGQDEATCVVYGMPRQAALLGAVEKTLPLGQIGRAICSLFAAQPEAAISANLAR